MCLDMNIKTKSLGSSIGQGFPVKSCPYCGDPGVLIKDKYTKTRRMVEWAHRFRITLQLDNEPRCEWGDVCNADRKEAIK